MMSKVSWPRLTYFSDNSEEAIDCGLSTIDEESFKAHSDVVSLMVRMKGTLKTTKWKSHCAAIF
jgi:hypothetical protein